ncbi:hypothetical protein [Sphingomonas psychrotolerans]|uniref:hypothetical protein n=1 Tax=Sphingomonas psychrotolerans TaxID=1327635 RepID=UPI001305451B|nr:hypothetical protein [Sphingomonas psychrotolerans]
MSLLAAAVLVAVVLAERSLAKAIGGDMIATMLLLVAGIFAVALAAPIFAVSRR